MKALKLITEDTAVSVGFLVAIIGAVMWLTDIAFVGNSNAKAIENLSAKQDQYHEDIAQMKTDIAIIKANTKP